MRLYVNWLDSLADNEEVLGSSPSRRTKTIELLGPSSSGVERPPEEQRVGGAKPSSATNLFGYTQQVRERTVNAPYAGRNLATQAICSSSFKSELSTIVNK